MVVYTNEHNSFKQLTYISIAAMQSAEDKEGDKSVKRKKLTEEQKERERQRLREHRSKMTDEQREKERSRLREFRFNMTEEQKEGERKRLREYRAQKALSAAAATLTAYIDPNRTVYNKKSKTEPQAQHRVLMTDIKR
jgi:hypothetical protein